MFVVVSICDFSFVKTKCIAADNQCIILPDYFTLLFLAFSKNLRNLRFTSLDYMKMRKHTSQFSQLKSSM